uniref:uncharacterized protein LOC123995221 isoform X2 n=1 Tax=Oncorhynchus gorbuscha TaxID=8017 RepID=UPI001EAEAE86|nr:uncharacterized protein LOC123995221 isoform X2 [Oncorhynchus gorbuscha]
MEQLQRQQEAGGGLGSPAGVRLEAVMEQLQRQQEAGGGLGSPAGVRLEAVMEQLQRQQEAGGGLGSPAGVRLEAVMEQLQRQQEAKLEMDRQEKHLRQAQTMFAKHVAVAWVTGAPLDSAFLGKRVEGTGTGRTPQMGQQQTEAGGSNDNTQSCVDRGDDNREEGGVMEDEEERMEGEEEVDDVGMGRGHMTKMSPLQQERSLSSFCPSSTSPSAAAKHRDASPPMNLKRRSGEKDLSTTEQHSFTSSNGFGDWRFDDGTFKQRLDISE